MIRSFYVEHSRWSDPGSFRPLVLSWSPDPLALSGAVDAVLRHPRGPSVGAVPFTNCQWKDLHRRSARELLEAALERGGLIAPDPSRKAGGVCRDFALLAVSALRERGTPARLRAGFVDYLVPGFYEDHWLCEYHSGGRWRRLDVEVAAEKAAGRDLAFDPTDVPAERFLSASEAWTAIALGRSDPARFGVSALGLTGLWFVAGSLLRDEAALMKIEVKPWDIWDIGERARDLAESQLVSSERLAAAARRLADADRSDPDSPPPGFADWQAPEMVVGYPEGTAVTVRLT